MTYSIHNKTKFGQCLVHSPYRIVKFASILFILLLIVGCGSSSTNSSDNGDNTKLKGDVVNDQTNDAQQDTRAPHSVTWLKEGNFWKVAWSEIEIKASWTDKGGNYDVGSYTMKLGSARVINGIPMHNIELSGDTEKYAPLWTAIGANDKGDIFGLNKDSNTPVLIYSETDNNWAGTGFYTDFDKDPKVKINLSSTIIPSQYTKESPYFEEPMRSVGYSSNDQVIHGGTGCDYFPGYGTICGSGPSRGPSKDETHLEYWSPEAGPVAMLYSYNYEDCLGVFCNEKHVDQRVEVWFFGDTNNNDFSYENEPDTYANPTPIPADRFIFTMFGEINDLDFSSGFIDGINAQVGMDIASKVHDWYSFEITEDNKDLTVDFYLFWDHEDANLDFYLYSAPDNDIYGFLYLSQGDSFAFEDFKHAKFLSGTYLPGKYLLGVIRTSENPDATGYGIMSSSGKVK